MGSQITVVHEERSRRRWAAVGFLLIVSLTIIAWFISPAVIDWMGATFREFRNIPLNKMWKQIVFTVIIAFILALVTALIVTLFVPKKAINVKDKELTKERLDGVKLHQKQKKRQRKLNREMRNYIEQNPKK